MDDAVQTLAQKLFDATLPTRHANGEPVHIPFVMWRDDTKNFFTEQAKRQIDIAQ
jgi:hypothetical protein